MHCLPVHLTKCAFWGKKQGTLVSRIWERTSKHQMFMVVRNKYIIFVWHVRCTYYNMGLNVRSCGAAFPIFVVVEIGGRNYEHVG